MTRLRRTRTPAGRRLEVSHVIAAPADEAWDLLVDTARWPEWSPTISAVESSDRRACEGTRGRIRVPGVWLPFTVTECRERRLTRRVAGLGAATYRVDDLGSERCRVAVELPLRSAATAPAHLGALERIERALPANQVAS